MDCFGGRLGARPKIKISKNNTNKSILKYLVAGLGAGFKFNILVKLYQDLLLEMDFVDDQVLMLFELRFHPCKLVTHHW